MLTTPEQILELQRKLSPGGYPEGQAGCCESRWKKMIGKPYSGNASMCRRHTNRTYGLMRGNWKPLSVLVAVGACIEKTQSGTSQAPALYSTYRPPNLGRHPGENLGPGCLKPAGITGCPACGGIKARFALPAFAGMTANDTGAIISQLLPGGGEASFDAEREIAFGPHQSVHFAYMRMRGERDDKAMRERRPATYTQGLLRQGGASRRRRRTSLRTSRKEFLPS